MKTFETQFPFLLVKLKGSPSGRKRAACNYQGWKGLYSFLTPVRGGNRDCCCFVPAQQVLIDGGPFFCLKKKRHAHLHAHLAEYTVFMSQLAAI